MSWFSFFSIWFVVAVKELDPELLAEKNANFFGKIAPSGIEDINISVVVEPSKNTGSLVGPGVELFEHMLDEKCLAMINEDNPDGFTWMRSGIVADVVKELTGCDCLLQLSDPAPDGAEQDDDIE